ncbi:hypothetical protein SPYCA_2468 [Sphingopyxis sp. FD7]|jgi:hypothetical protein|nr:hypothetical protein SPYCA_2468 [Sphingopyxis sp. FD7]
MTDKGKAGIHPKAAIRHKKLSYMARLRQPSSRLFQMWTKRSPPGVKARASIARDLRAGRGQSAAAQG